MKLIRLFLYCLLTLLLPAFHVRGQAPDAQAMRADVEARVREFYTYYCHALDSSPGPLDNPAKLKSYVTARFLTEIKRTGEREDDPFCLADDVDPGWSKSIRVANAKASTDGKQGVADVTLGGSQKDATKYLRVSVVNEGGVYKVDKVKDLRP